MHSKQTYKIGDSYDLLDEVDKVDMLLTDIPYNISQKSNGLRKLDYGEWDKNSTDKTFKILEKALSKVTGSAYVFCDPTQISQIILYMKDLGMTTRPFIWIKNNPTILNADCLWESAVEVCAYGKYPSAIYNYHCKPNYYTTNVVRQYRVHPTQKSLQLFIYLVEASTKIGDTVLDPFLGSGTTLIACNRTNRNCIGFEISKEWEQNYIDRGGLETHRINIVNNTEAA